MIATLALALARNKFLLGANEVEPEVKRLVRETRALIEVVRVQPPVTALQRDTMRAQAPSLAHDAREERLADAGVAWLRRERASALMVPTSVPAS